MEDSRPPPAASESLQVRVSRGGPQDQDPSPQAACAFIQVGRPVSKGPGSSMGVGDLKAILWLLLAGLVDTPHSLYCQPEATFELFLPRSEQKAPFFLLWWDEACCWKCAGTNSEGVASKTAVISQSKAI